MKSCEWVYVWEGIAMNDFYFAMGSLRANPA